MGDLTVLFCDITIQRMNKDFQIRVHVTTNVGLFTVTCKIVKLWWRSKDMYRVYTNVYTICTICPIVTHAYTHAHGCMNMCICMFGIIHQKTEPTTSQTNTNVKRTTRMHEDKTDSSFHIL